MQFRFAVPLMLVVGPAFAQTPASADPDTAVPSADTTAPAATGTPSAAPEENLVPTAPAPVPPAVAEPPRRRSKIYERLEAGGFLGWGVQLDGQATRPFGLALGLRGGAVLPNHLYFGLLLGAFAGQSERAFTYGTYSYRVSLWQSQLGLEGGYDVDLGPLTLRPYLGLGVNRTISSVSYAGFYTTQRADLGSSTDLYVNVGGLAHLELTDRVYGGLDARFDLVTSGPARTALVLAASGGVRFF